MPPPDFSLKILKDSTDLPRLAERLASLRAFALDIETIDWWNRHQERIALIQIAYCSASATVADQAVEVTRKCPIVDTRRNLVRKLQQALCKILIHADLSASDVIVELRRFCKYVSDNLLQRNM